MQMDPASVPQGHADELVECARYGELDNVKTLCETHNLPVSVTDIDGNLPLHMAAANGHLDCVEYLLERGNKEQINQKNKSGNTPLHWAALNGRESVVRLFVDHQGDVNVQNDDGKSPIYEAMNNGHESCAQILFEKAEAPNSATQGETTENAEDEASGSGA
eukprot:Clim_evm18s164 gene=Clim_evmTU18s164